MSIVYCLGSILLSVSSGNFWGTEGHHDASIETPVSLLGLLLIAIGTGGIKPCVSSFGGDQFKLPEQRLQLAQFFSIFYFSINAGSLISTFVTPIFRQDVKCFGQDSCYPLAFGVPAVIMVVALGKSLAPVQPRVGNPHNALVMRVVDDLLFLIWNRLFQLFSSPADRCIRLSHLKATS